MRDFKEAMYYEKMNNGRVKCFLCPHRCTIKDGYSGICGVRKNKNGILNTINYGKISSYAYDPIEKKPLRNFYPNTRIFSIGSFGCNLKCRFCQNWQISQQLPPTIEIPDKDILALAGENSIGIAYTYNEPTIWYEYVFHIAKKIREIGLKNVLVTNGYIEQEPLKELLPFIDALNIDLKSYDDEYYRELCGGNIGPILETIKMSAEKSHVEITTLIVEGENDSPEKIGSMAYWISQIDKNIPLHITRYFPAYKMNNPPTSLDILTELKEQADKYLKYVYLGNV
ncbi:MULTISPECIES: AmmeMemoRadiSam system radical SAM enzyme [Tissierellales]|uniref:AmmeMemoRadiSam system radical SAM enzyme n=1 Tax=Acidilutibacter cellobiosedens TaxID=2507161 RepID=A0A410Q972_9FIRM|nr:MULTISPECIES: AmmeMemoRadiSam system radical SAM enzyme [Tissierellales]MBE6082083.1 AmmeMemoRadiSam system radical SAM enzyme [Tissierellaceae bacterium]QAT60530.1 AmmeMemoRadiSam system radical SAM enzyme [Acidilutibacter cellobiosedens]SCL86756.1 Pyruvate formate-lyase 1-activating enzyme [Sporanaerobacter sp. PP17-6a]